MVAKQDGEYIVVVDGEPPLLRANETIDKVEKALALTDDVKVYKVELVELKVERKVELV